MLKKIDFLDVSPIYSIDEYGNIFSENKNGYLSQKTDKDGYLSLSLSKGSRGNVSHVRVATLVILAFIGEAPLHMNDPTVDHIDNNIINNYYKNLRWVERGENARLAHVGITVGEKNHFYGKKHSLENKQKMREMNIGKRYSDEVNKKKASPKKCILFNEDGEKEIFPSAKELSVHLETSYVTCIRYLRGDRGGITHYYKPKKCYLFYDDEIQPDIIKNIFGSSGK